MLFEATRQESVALRAAIASASPDWRQALEEWERLRHHYSTVALQSGSEAGRLARPEHKEVDPAEMLSLRDRIEQLEQRLRRDNPAYALQSRLQQVSLEQVQQALRSGEALIEYVLYYTLDRHTNKWEKLVMASLCCWAEA